MSHYGDIDVAAAIPLLFEKVKWKLSCEIGHVAGKDRSGAAKYLVRWIASTNLNSYQMRAFLKYILHSASSGTGSLEEAAHIASHAPSAADLARAGKAGQKGGGVESSGASRLDEKIQKLTATGTAMLHTLDAVGKRLSKTATKSDLRAATRTILRGEDVDKAKPGPQMNAAKRQQIAAVEQYRKSHVWSSLHNACQKAFVKVDGGFRSPGALYAHLHAEEKSDRK